MLLCRGADDLFGVTQLLFEFLTGRLDLRQLVHQLGPLLGEVGDGVGQRCVLFCRGADSRFGVAQPVFQHRSRCGFPVEPRLELRLTLRGIVQQRLAILVGALGGLVHRGFGSAQTPFERLSCGFRPGDRLRQFLLATG